MSIRISKSQAEEVLKSLDQALKSEVWEKSNFLKMISKNLQNIRDDFAQKVHVSEKDVETPTNVRRAEIKPGQREIFVSLYSSNGSSLQNWEKILNNLSKQIISRPIYADEEAIRTIIKTKENRINEAYISLFIQETSLLVLPQDKISYDKLGQPLLTLKDNALSVENINRFEHYSGTYTFANTRLLKMANTGVE